METRENVIQPAYLHVLRVHIATLITTFLRIIEKFHLFTFIVKLMLLAYKLTFPHEDEV
jgi:hypothetical protein